MYIVLYGRGQDQSFCLFDVREQGVWLDPQFLALLGEGIWGPPGLGR